MHATFWQARWARNEIGFHAQEVNPYLQRHWPALGVPGEARVLVPLCGKSLDLAWLAAQGWRVLGVEVAQKAIEDFFREHQLQAQMSREGAFKVYRSGSLEIYCGDFFALTAQQLSDCRVFYDRAALIALPAEMRVRYAAHLRRVLPPDCQGLLVTLDYEQAQMQGPPFAVSEREVQSLFAEQWQLALLEAREVLGENDKFLQRGLQRLDERVYRLGARV
ncbi:thiopurine S-methyltransferase [Pseudomonas sp. UBA2684]|uniref:thiopurine S-methyltransferase n=1 Tax=Pseudomonas sp. UBA2684 TaxID=1947311 RepID=UPI000E7F2BF6|nr:thiopurine S-methyltransferase [Pseudomonas sp. UBA2684]HBX53948.1 thiopurine S-methyltransferase [Pseudomonas sp.]|tara:strand:- start:179 stop:838 length:660 start_codon:yes stop_codon:yes gene_type:complete